MVESERYHRRRGRKIEFFLCFSSRSSSSMKISSKSILSPGRTREPMSLSSSLSRRLRSNGSLKGGQASPMFPTGSKKKGGSFEPPEPSSPKVTCIGQVRVKSKKKHGRKLRTRSQRKGEVSFRKTELPQDGIHHQQPVQQECLPHRNQRWVHLPLSICETLRAFGADFNCFAPCGNRNSSCSWSNEREKVEKRRGGSNSCGAVFARWLFALHESEEKGREIESVVKEQEKSENRENIEVVPEIDMEEQLETKLEETEDDEVEEPRESICIPPKNALLLMRSRSAPFRMSSLANRFWDSPAPQEKNAEDLEIADIEENEEEEEMENIDRSDEEREELDIQQALEEDKEVGLNIEAENREEEMLENLDSAETFEEEAIIETRHKGPEIPENVEQQQEEEQIEGIAEITLSRFSLDSFEEEEKGKETELQVEGEEEEEMKVMVEKEKKEERRVSFSSSTIYLEPEEESDPEEEAEQAIEERIEDISLRSTEEQQINHEEDQEDDDEEEDKSLLPECLLLMMCEPKLSMEVSKETWVCSTDFIRIRQPEKKVNQKNGRDESTKKRLSTDSNPAHPRHITQQQPKQQKKQEKQIQVQPPRSSCSKVVATVVEKKLTNTAGLYEPFVLKRSKSEPMRNSAKLAPEVCFWNENKLEPHRPPSLGVGATG